MQIALARLTANLVVSLWPHRSSSSLLLVRFSCPKAITENKRRFSSDEEREGQTKRTADPLPPPLGDIGSMVVDSSTYPTADGHRGKGKILFFRRRSKRFSSVANGFANGNKEKNVLEMIPQQANVSIAFEGVGRRRERERERERIPPTICSSHVNFLSFQRRNERVNALDGDRPVFLACRPFRFRR